MTRQTLDDAVVAAQEFIRRAQKVRWKAYGPNEYPESTVESAATRRASLDLTRALARMRRV